MRVLYVTDVKFQAIDFSTKARSNRGLWLSKYGFKIFCVYRVVDIDSRPELIGKPHGLGVIIVPNTAGLPGTCAAPTNTVLEGELPTVEYAEFSIGTIQAQSR